MNNYKISTHNKVLPIKVISTLFIFFLSVEVFSQIKSDFVLTPCTGNSVLNSKTTEAELIKMVGKKNADRVERWYTEGTEKVIGTVFFKDTPQSFFIKWRDTVSFKNPEWIEIHGDKSLWEIDNGIKIGTDLKELIKLNGKHFRFSGFDWDYGGYAVFEKGNLESDCYSVQLYYDYENLFENEWNQIVGDKMISTKNPVLNKIKIYVDLITFYFK
ncbi:MAG: hypothetical protein RBR74_06470 [Ignavibacteriaceae bacterium]|jgi:hypothetical protein|nr:hypothetical protein [Ignavibacteriaceae bacterium]